MPLLMDLIGGVPKTAKLLTYRRYTTSFTERRDLLCAVGRAIALEQVRKEIFHGFLYDDYNFSPGFMQHEFSLLG